MAKDRERKLNISRSKKNIRYDQQDDVLYIGIKEGPEEEFIEIAPGVNVELDADGKVIGIEILNASHILEPLYKTMEQKRMFQHVLA